MLLGTAIYAPLAAMTAASGGLFVADLSLVSAGARAAAIDPHAVLLPLDSRTVGIPFGQVLDARDDATPALGMQILRDQLAEIDEVWLPERPFAHLTRFNAEAFCRFLYDHLGLSFRAEQDERAALEKIRTANLRASLEKIRPGALSTLDLYQKVEERFARYGVTFGVARGRPIGPFETTGVYQWGRHIKDITSRGSKGEGEAVFKFDEETLIAEIYYLFQTGLLSKFAKTPIHLFVEHEFSDLSLKFVYPRDFQREGYETLGVEVNGRYIGDINSFDAAGIIEFMPAPLSAAVTRLMIQQGILGSHKRDGVRPEPHSEERTSV